MKQAIRNYIVKDLLRNRGDIDIKMSDDILSSGMIDSIGVLQLITFIENLTDVKVPPEDMVIENFVTIDAIEHYINQRKEAR